MALGQTIFIDNRFRQRHPIPGQQSTPVNLLLVDHQPGIVASTYQERRQSHLPKKETASHNQQPSKEGSG